MLSFVSNFFTPTKKPNSPANILTLESGELYSSDKLLFKSSQLKVLANKNLLMVNKVYSEDDYYDDQDDDDEKQFFIAEPLAFHLTEKPSFIWLDPTDNHRYEWVPEVPTVAINDIKDVEKTVHECIFQTKFNADRLDPENSTPMQEYIDQLKPHLDKFHSTDTFSVPAIPEKETPVKKEEIIVKEDKPVPTKSVKSYVQEFPGDGKIVAQSYGQTFIFDVRFQQFVLQHEKSEIQIQEYEQDEFWLFILVKDEMVLSQPIGPEISGIFRSQDEAFCWVYAENGVPCCSFSFKFSEIREFTDFSEMFGKVMYQTQNKLNFSTVKKEDEKYLLEAYVDGDDVDMVDNFASEEEEEEEEQQQQQEEEEDDDDEYIKEQLREEKGAKNSQLAVGYKYDRSFVVRGNKIGVFKHTEDNKLKHSSTINAIKTLDGNVFSPRKIMLHEQDSSILMMKPNDEHSIYKMDLEYGKVVEEWKVHDIVPVDEIIPDTKFSQMTPSKTLIGVNHNSIFRIDPRLSGNKRVESESKQYTTKNQFTCGATTGKGDLVVGSSKGEIRFFNKLNTRAKTALPGLGDAIYGVDTTKDGKFVVATCKTYLLLLNTEIKNDENNALAFNNAMPAAQRNPPKKLSLRPEHIAVMQVPLAFTPARFNTSAVGEETTIVTSSGPYVITWNFKKVKQGKLYDYHIKQYSDTVVADNFKFGQDSNIIVTLPENVEMIAKSSLTTPTKFLKSRNSFVNSPY